MFRDNQMMKLQKTHTWSPSRSEGMYGGFNKYKASHGLPNADLFVSFLGYIRDNSYAASQKNFNEEVKRYK